MREIAAAAIGCQPTRSKIVSARIPLGRRTRKDSVRNLRESAKSVRAKFVRTCVKWFEGKSILCADRQLPVPLAVTPVGTYPCVDNLRARSCPSVLLDACLHTLDHPGREIPTHHLQLRLGSGGQDLVDMVSDDPRAARIVEDDEFFAPVSAVEAALAD